MKKWSLYLGGFLLLLGFVSLVDVIWNVNLWSYLWPLILIGLGLIIIFRPKWFILWDWEGRGHNRFVGDYHTVLQGTGKDEQYNTFAGDHTIDLTNVVVPSGGINYKFNGFAGDVTIIVPENVGVRVRGNVFAGELDIFGDNMQSVMSPFEGETPGFDTAESKVFVEANYFACDVKLRRR